MEESRDIGTLILDTTVSWGGFARSLHRFEHWREQEDAVRGEATRSVGVE